MAPALSESGYNLENEGLVDEDRSLKDVWHSFIDWIRRFLSSINNETLEHPYLISFALLVLWAWPHILMLPIWFGQDAYRRMDAHARTAMDRAAAPARRRRRDGFMARYHSIVNASYEPEDTSRAPLFGGTPLTEGDLRIEEERDLPIALRVIRWSAFTWAMFIIGRELYFLLSRY